MHPTVTTGHGIVIPGFDPPSSILGGEAFLSRVYKRLQGVEIPPENAVEVLQNSMEMFIPRLHRPLRARPPPAPPETGCPARRRRRMPAAYPGGYDASSSVVQFTGVLKWLPACRRPACV